MKDELGTRGALGSERVEVRDRRLLPQTEHTSAELAVPRDEELHLRAEERRASTVQAQRARVQLL
jgi:hypothetical protein